MNAFVAGAAAVDFRDKRREPPDAARRRAFMIVGASRPMPLDSEGRLAPPLGLTGSAFGYSPLSWPLHLPIPREDAARLPMTGTPRRLPSGSRRTPTPARHGSSSARSATSGTPSGSRSPKPPRCSTENPTVSTSARGSVSIIGRRCACRVSLYGTEGQTFATSRLRFSDYVRRRAVSVVSVGNGMETAG